MQGERRKPRYDEKHEQRNFYDRKEIADVFSAGHTTIIHGGEKPNEERENAGPRERSFHGWEKFAEMMIENA